MTDSSQLVQKLWNFCSILRDDGLSYRDYLEQLTFLLFLKMDDEQNELAKAFNTPFKSTLPRNCNWQSLIKQQGIKLQSHYHLLLDTLSRESGFIGAIFHKAQNQIQDPAKLEHLIDLINSETWTEKDIDLQGNLYEGLLEKNAQDVKSGAGQYFTPRPLIQAIVDVMRPRPGEKICDPASGTGGFLLAALQVLTKSKNLSREQLKELQSNSLFGWEIVDDTARLCMMNLYLHGVDMNGSKNPIQIGDSLTQLPGQRFKLVLSNPPFGKKSSITIQNEKPESRKKQPDTPIRQDFWATTSNKQLNFLQHIKSILDENGRAAVVVPDNVLFEGGAGETIRRKLLQEFNVHTLLRLPTGLFYAQGVKANVLFFDQCPINDTPNTKELWIYDLRTNINFSLKQNPITRADLDEFVEYFQSENPLNRSEKDRWRRFNYNELVSRDKANLDIFWLKDNSITDNSNLPAPNELAAQILTDLELALKQFREIADSLQ